MGLRSLIGAFKVLACPLDNAVVGLESKEMISWSDELHSTFTSAQNGLSSTRAITVCRPADQLWIVIDGAERVLIRHVAGAAILPSDFASRNAPECDSPTCQVCAIVQSNSDSVVCNITAEDVVRGTAKLAFHGVWGLSFRCGHGHVCS